MSLESAMQSKKQEIAQLDWQIIPVEFIPGHEWDLGDLTLFNWASIFNISGLPSYSLCYKEKKIDFDSQAEAKAAVDNIIKAYYNLKVFIATKYAEVNAATTEEEVENISLTLPNLLT